MTGQPQVTTEVEHVIGYLTLLPPNGNGDQPTLRLVDEIRSHVPPTELATLEGRLSRLAKEGVGDLVIKLVPENKSSPKDVGDWTAFDDPLEWVDLDPRGGVYQPEYSKL